MSNPNDSRWLDPTALAAYLSLRVDRIQRLVREGKLPKADYTLGCRSPRWDKNAVDAWMTGGRLSKSAMVADANTASKDYAEKLHREAAEKRAAGHVHKGRRH